MSTNRSPTALFPSEADPEHILGRGFEINLSSKTIDIVDEDASTPPPIVLRSAWGKAVRTEREAWPYDFQPLLYSGTQLWHDRALLIPPMIPSIFPAELFGRGSGAFVTLDEVADHHDAMEFVFLPEFPDSVVDEVYMAWVVLDAAPAGVDPFVVAATRVLEPLISELRNAATAAKSHAIDPIRELGAQVENLSEALRDLQDQPARLRTAVTVGLTALSTIVLNLLSSRLDPVIDRIDWPTFYNAILEALRQLALG